MKQLVTSFICILFFTNNIESQTLQVSVDEILIATRNYLGMEYPQDNFSILQVTPLIGQKGNTVLYEITTNKGRNLLFSGHKACFPILGDYNSGNNSIIAGLSNNTLPCNIKEFINAYIEQIEYAFEDGDTTQYHRKEWSELLGRGRQEYFITRNIYN